MQSRSIGWAGLFFLVLSSWLFLGCGGGENSTKIRPNEPSFQESDDKTTFMGLQVFGPMKSVFQGFDADRFKSFGCGTCHLAGNNKDYKMPSGIFPMDPNNMPKEDDPTYGKTVKFMKEKVLPKMKEILNDNSLTCFSCHGKKS